MKTDLIFHLLLKKNWKNFIKNGAYTPESLAMEGFIHCLIGEQINETANRLLERNNDFWLLVIDTKSVSEPIKYETDGEKNEAFPHIYGPLNLDAILDKISIKKHENEKINLEYISD